MNNQLHERIDMAVHTNPHVTPRMFRWEAVEPEGRVVLSGNVRTFYQKQMAQEVIKNVDGVESVENYIEVTW